MKTAVRSHTVSVLLVFVTTGWFVATFEFSQSNLFVGIILGVAPSFLYLLVRVPVARLLTTVLGGVAVLGGSSELGAPKLLFAVALVLCGLISTFNLYKRKSDQLPTVLLRPTYVWSLLFASTTIIGVSLSLELNDLTSLARQSVFYIILLFGPIVAIDTGKFLSKTQSFTLVIVIGLVAAVAFTIDWLNRRGVTALEVDRIGLSTLALPALAFLLSTLLFFNSRSIWTRLALGFVIVAIPVLLLSTGTRSSLAIFAGLFALIGSSSRGKIPIVRIILLTLAAALVGVIAFNTFVTFAISDTGFIETRLNNLFLVIGGNAQSDLSYTFRSQQFEYALELFSNRPLFGFGLGYPIDFTLDTPIITLVRFGVVGTALLLGYFVVFNKLMNTVVSTTLNGVARITWHGFAIYLVAMIPLGSPLEDHGLGFALTLLVLIASSSKEPSPSSDGALNIYSHITR